MSTLEIIILTVVATIIIEVIIFVILSIRWGKKHFTENVVYYHGEELNLYGRPFIHSGWEEVVKDENVKFKLPPIRNIHDILNDCLNNLPPDTHEEYLGKLEEYKKIMDESPNKFLDSHLETALKNEQYELAQYIKDVAEKRKFKLNQ